MLRRSLLVVFLGMLLAAPTAQGKLAPEARWPLERDVASDTLAGRLEEIVAGIEGSSVPGRIGVDRWQNLLTEHRPELEQAASHQDLAEAVNALLHQTDLSHLHYFTDGDWLYWHLRSALEGGPPTHTDHIGLIPQQIEGRWFVRGILEGSPAAESPLRVGDEILSVNRQPYKPLLSIRGKAEEPVWIEIRREAHTTVGFPVTPVRESMHAAIERAMIRSIRTIPFNGHRFAYLHGWSLLGFGQEYQRLLELQPNVDGLLLDYRDGVGGISGPAMQFFLGSTGGSRWTKPAVVLIADGTRSAKEIVVHELQTQGRATLLGTPTPGHVTTVGRLVWIGSDGLLMLPGLVLPLEGHPTEPDVLVERDIRFAAGFDPQLAAAARVLAKMVATGGH